MLHFGLQRQRSVKISYDAKLKSLPLVVYIMNCFVNSEMETIQSQMYPTAGNTIDNNSRNVLLFECDNSTYDVWNKQMAVALLTQLTYLLKNKKNRGRHYNTYVTLATLRSSYSSLCVHTHNNTTRHSEDASLYCVCSCLFWCLVNL